MNKKLLYILAFTMVVCTLASAQTRYIDGVKFDNVSNMKADNHIQLSMNVNVDDLNIGRNDMLILTPVLRSNTGSDSLEFTPIIYLGGTRNKVVERNERLGNVTNLPANASMIVYKKNRMNDADFNGSLPYMTWMNNAALYVRGDVKGCADCGEYLGDRLLVDRIFKEPYIPSYKLTYIVPEVEPVKVRADRHTASFNFVVAKHDLIRDYKNNAAEFARVDKVVGEVVSNKDLTITEFAVEGYASPEGNYESNRALAERRANSFADYLVSAHGVSKSQFKVTGRGEDWEGLKKAVTESSLPTKSQVLDIIATTANPDARDAKIRAIDGGKTYKDLLTNYYPPLRRTDYVIAYNVRPFSVEEAREVIKTNPRLLSLNEMYLVAKSYPADSREFKEVFDIATRLYPDEPIAIINASAADIEGGNYQAAIDRLSRLSDNSAALNNIGVAYARMGDDAKAMDYFKRSADKGDTDAKHNIEELKKANEE